MAICVPKFTGSLLLGTCLHSTYSPDYLRANSQYPQLGWSLFSNNLEDRVDKSSKENHGAREKEDEDRADRLNWMKIKEAAEEALEKEENDDAEIISAQKKVGKGGAREKVYEANGVRYDRCGGAQICGFITILSSLQLELVFFY